MRYREDRMPLLDTLAAPFMWLLRVPAWSALPVSLATGSLILAGAGFYWDVSVHIDRGRDPGPFGTPAHYPILIGLFGIFAAGWLALVMARGQDARRTGCTLSPTWTVPTSGLVMAACGGFALIGFPLDDIWHSIFGQDVTLRGPTHLIMLTGGQLMIPTILGLLCEGRAARGAPVATGVPAQRGCVPRLGAYAIAVTGAGGMLAGLTIYQAEFGFGVPQYNLLFQPALLAFSAGVALVFGRAVLGRGGALAAAVVNIAISAAFVIFVAVIPGQATAPFLNLPAGRAGRRNRGAARSDAPPGGLRRRRRGADRHAGHGRRMGLDARVDAGSVAAAFRAISDRRRGPGRGLRGAGGRLRRRLAGPGSRCADRDPTMAARRGRRRRPGRHPGLLPAYPPSAGERDSRA